MAHTEDLGIVDALAQLSFLVQGSLASQAAAHDLSMIQVRLLGVLRDRTPSMNELGALLRLDKSSVCGLIDRASARGLVTRVPSERDRRAVHVRLTRRGRTLVTHVAAEFGADVNTMVERLTPTERTRLSVLASQVVARADA